MNIDIIYHILLSFVFGAVIGLERQLKGKVVGVRTTSLICTGTMLFIYLGTTLDGDKARVLGQVITGIGFLGAGSILAKEGKVSGLTSASVVWSVAAIGSAVGLGRYDLGAIMTITTIGILVGVQWFEDLFDKLTSKND